MRSPEFSYFQMAVQAPFTDPDHFTEFDPVKRALTFTKATMSQMAMAMTEDDKGKIWAVTYPNSGIVSFDPKTRELKDYVYVNKENWRQYQRAMAADNTG